MQGRQMWDKLKWDQRDNVVLGLDHLVLLSVYCLHLHIFFLTFTFSLFIQNGQEMQTWDLCAKLSVDPIYSSEFVLIFTFVWGQHGSESLIYTASIMKPAGSCPGRSKSDFEVHTCNMHLYTLQSWWHWVHLLWKDSWSLFRRCWQLLIDETWQ